MFSFFFQSVNNNKFSANKMSTRSACDCDEATVFVWSGGIKSLGHVSLKLSDEDPDPIHNQPLAYYASIWPQFTPAGGPTSIFPLRATFSDSLKSDCLQEAERPSAEFVDIVGPQEIKPIQPDKTLCIKNLDKNKIKLEFDRIKSGLAEGRIRYQLLPGVNTSKILNALNATQPVDEVYNCVTLTQHLLKKGGMDQLSNADWTTPATFGNQLLDQDKTEQIFTDEVSHRMHP